MMYDKLIKNLRHDSASALQNCEFDFVHSWMLKAADAIEELQKRKRGEWIKAVDGFDGSWVCSECMEEYVTVDADFIDYAHYCPNCGVKMEREDN